MSSHFSRRSVLKKMTGAAAGLSLLPFTGQARPSADLEGDVNQAVVGWPFLSSMNLETLAQASSEMGLYGIDYLAPEDWDVLERHGLVCTLAQGPEGTGSSTGFIQAENHEWLIPGYKERIRETADAGYSNIMVFSGNSNGLTEEEGLENAVTGLKQIVSDAEAHDVTLVIEILNSKVDHPGYMFDNMDWGIKLVDRVGSDNLKILYDIYHAQIMEGDVIRTIRDYNDYIGHYHTAGVPGRNEIDETQELYYPAIMRAILETGFDGYVAHEFRPLRDPLTSLQEAVDICDVEAPSETTAG